MVASPPHRSAVAASLVLNTQLTTHLASAVVPCGASQILKVGHPKIAQAWQRKKNSTLTRKHSGVWLAIVVSRDAPTISHQFVSNRENVAVSGPKSGQQPVVMMDGSNLIQSAAAASLMALFLLGTLLVLCVAERRFAVRACLRRTLQAVKRLEQISREFSQSWKQSHCNSIGPAA